MTEKITDKLIEEWIDKNRERIISDWIELIKIPSITSEKKDGAPFGEECARALSFAAGLFDSDGITNEVYADGGYALAHYGEGEKTIGLFSHSDVVPVGEGWIFTEPFNPVIKEGSLIGRGSEDNKSGIIASLCLMEFLRDNDIKLNSRLEAFIGSDEECGMKDLKAYLSAHKVPDVSFVPDADFPCSTGEKGIYHFWAKSNGKFEQIISVSGGEAFNIVLDKATIVITGDEAFYNQIKAVFSECGNATVSYTDGKIEICSRGIAKHASIPEGSVNAAYIAFEKLIECDGLCENDRNILKGALKALSCYYGKGLNIYHEDINFGNLTCVNGIVKIEDGALMLSFDVRYGDTMNPTELESKADEALAQLGFSAMGKDNSPGFSIDADSKLPAVFEDIFYRVTGIDKKSVLMSGGTYARKLKNAFSIGTSVILPGNEDKVLRMPEGHGGPHQCDERIDIDGFFNAVKVLINYVIAADEIIAD